ncbi:MAG TPA: DUF3300 domain-containing protein [Casimicrobiaceae bacterium]|nr:DUF3300 domain-containing protein [Casimicrobiaceae bacterium]
MRIGPLRLYRPALMLFVAIAACGSLIGAAPVAAQAPAASGNAAQAPSPEALEALVGRIALYPDDLVTVILPASTNPLQIVQADRFLQKRKQDPKAPLDDNWDDAVKTLLNYPDVVTMMSNDLDWTSDLGEAVVANQSAVLDAVQAFRRKAQSAGNLKTDDKQVVEVEKEVIKIVPADPQVIYVPQYNPTTVVTYGVPAWGYYPTPYPSYYYPYPPGAAFASGLIWGAAIGAAWNGGRYGWGGNNEININRNTNINTGDRNSNNRGQRPSQGGSTAWKSDKKPGQVRSGSGTTGRSAQTSGRVGDSRGGGGYGGGAGGGARPSQGGGGAMGQGGGGRNQPGAGSTAGAATRTGGGGGSAGRGDAFGGYGSGSAARADSSRGASSRSSMSSSGRSSGASRGGGGGGGARGGGGGGRGGGGRR